MPSKYELLKNFNVDDAEEDKYHKVDMSYPTRTVKTYHPLHTMAVDLIDLSKDTQFRCNYIMIAIDLFSRKVFYAFMNKKDVPAIGQGFERIFSQMDGTPRFIWTDGEKAIYSHEIQEYLRDDYDITTYQTYGRVHNPIAERVIRTLKEIVEKVRHPMKERNKKIALEDIFKKAVEIYNNTVHSSIKHTPNEAFEDEKALHFIHKINEEKAKELKFQGNQFKVGDKVLLLLDKEVFKKGYKKKFSDEEFTIIERRKTNPETYVIRSDEKPNVILSNIYTQQLKLSDRAVFIGEENEKDNKKMYQRMLKRQ